jgi:regulator of replication initiation timing
MKQSITMVLVMGLILGSGCTKKNQEEDQKKNLYDQVMEIHDEAMPSMGELNRLKRELQQKIKESPDLVEEKRREIEQTIVLLDSASKSMMVWMREFNPEDFEGDTNAYREYLEGEMKRVQQVKEAMLDALEKGRRMNQ